MILGHKIRIYPNKTQEQKLLQTVGCSRFVYNWGLDTWNRWYQDFKDGKRTDKPNNVKLSKLWTKERPEWAAALPRSGQDRALKDVATAFAMFFKRASKRPTFKKVGCCVDSYYIGNHHGKIRKDGKHLHLPSIGDMRMAEPLRFEGKVMSYVVTHYAGQWHVSIRVELPDTRTAPDSVAGVDVGMKIPAICSDGNSLILPKEKLYRLEKQLKKSQRVVSRRQKKSRNRAKALLRKQKIQLKISNIRRDAIHKFTSAVCKNHATVVIEDLNCTGLHKVPIKNIRKGMARSCMYEVRQQLSYKAIVCIVADKWFPSTQLCSNCGGRKKLTLDTRVYSCPYCGAKIDRDLNAAINLAKYAEGHSVKAHGENVTGACSGGSR